MSSQVLGCVGVIVGKVASKKRGMMWTLLFEVVIVMAEAEVGRRTAT